MCTLRRAVAAASLAALTLLVGCMQPTPAPDNTVPLAAGEVKFFGTSCRATRVAFLVEWSGSMCDSVVQVKTELKRSIQALGPSQEFQVIFYAAYRTVAMADGKSLRATEANKRAACEFMDRTELAGVGADPSRALETAFAAHADAIMLLTDGTFDEKIVPLIDRLNVGRKVAIHTFCVLYTEGEPLLQEIAIKSGGQYRYIGE
jgi:hypothetical protein